MPGLNLIATPTPTASAAASAAVPAGDAAASGSRDGAPSDPFATVLVRQIGRQTAHETGVEEAPSRLAAEPDKDAVPGEDMAALMPMLLGMATPPADAAAPSVAKDAKGGIGNEKEDAAALLAAAVSPQTAGANDAALSDKPTAKEAAAADLALPAADSKAPAPSAILAGASAGKEQGATQGDGSKPPSFDTLLSAARDAQPTAPAHMAAAHTAPEQRAAPAVQVDAPVGTHGWDNAVADKVVWMVDQRQSKAELVLNPPQMGRIEVSLTVSGDQANAVFVSANPEVRQALEDALPRLREVMADAGINLGQAQVGAQSSGNSAGNGENRDNSFRGQAAIDSDLAVASDAATGNRNPWLRSGRGLVDTFA